MDRIYISHHIRPILPLNKYIMLKRSNKKKKSTRRILHLTVNLMYKYMYSIQCTVRWLDISKMWCVLAVPVPIFSCSCFFNVITYNDNNNLYFCGVQYSSGVQNKLFLSSICDSEKFFRRRDDQRHHQMLRL